MDIIRILKFTHLKASFSKLAWKQKFFFIIFLASFTTTLVPHEAFSYTPPEPTPVLIFDLTNDDYEDYLAQMSEDATDEYYREQLHQQVVRQLKLTQAVREYLVTQGSPLAEYASTLVTVRNWKKIVALANAESSMCKRYPEDKANCWGVGGSNLWDMGDNLGQGIISMNHFLNQYPKGVVKYSQMSFERMNGFYKQPAADHWLYNNTSVYSDLVALENNL